ncbi:ATPase protein [Halorhabdus tiamatea SARL4B]|uniref:ATPase protein n=1 Tax=Halorhabdus tiamatea SARL4B TaxID=1033806 RepID=U2DMV4_9EURY|nr:ATPase protein [Halorhabdus tiamatea SARL4B]
MNIVPDTSVVIDGRVSDRIADGEFAGATVAVPEAVVGELEAQANEGRQTGLGTASRSSNGSPTWQTTARSTSSTSAGDPNRASDGPPTKATSTR